MAVDNKKRSCRFCDDGVEYIDFRKPKTLSRSVTEIGTIIPRRTSGTCAHHQRQLQTAIKRARILGLMPFVNSVAR
jgi:small subunit ribosomal protein S18